MVSGVCLVWWLCMIKAVNLRGWNTQQPVRRASPRGHASRPMQTGHPAQTAPTGGPCCRKPTKRPATRTALQKRFLRSLGETPAGVCALLSGWPAGRQCVSGATHGRGRLWPGLGLELQWWCGWWLASAAHFKVVMAAAKRSTAAASVSAAWVVAAACSAAA